MHRTPLVILLLVAAPSAACLQELDPNVTGGAVPGESTATDAGLVYAKDGVCPPGMVPGGSDGVNSDASPNMGHGVCLPVAAMTPPIQVNWLDDGAATNVGCEATKAQAWTIRQIHCAQCHDTATAGQPMGAFGWVLDDDQLAHNMVNGMPLVVPGDPDHSTLYNFVAKGIMPKPPAPHLPVSDVSILRSWIDCMGTGNTPAPAPGQNDAAAGVDGDTGKATLDGSADAGKG